MSDQDEKIGTDKWSLGSIVDSNNNARAVIIGPYGQVYCINRYINERWVGFADEERACTLLIEKLNEMEKFIFDMKERAPRKELISDNPFRVIRGST